MVQVRSLAGRFIFTLNFFLWAVLLAVLFISLAPVTETMLEPLAVKEDIRNADAIVVLGAGIDRGRFLTLETSRRLVRGAQLYYEKKAPKIILSGGVLLGGGVAEGEVLAQEARRLGIPSEDIMIEKNSKRTSEQGEEIKKMVTRFRWKSLLLVTSFLHMKRSLLVFEKQGFKVYPAPADPLERNAEGPLERMDLFFKILLEYCGTMYYRVRGWI